MARASYLARRDGRYFIQVRFSVRVAPLMGKTLYRAALRTSDFRIARTRLNDCLSWLLPMNDVPDYMHLFQLNVRDLAERVREASPFPEHRLYARQQYEELLKNLNRRALAAGFDVTVPYPEYRELFNLFVKQNADTEAHYRSVERIREYERGRSEMQIALQYGAIPSVVSETPTAPVASKAGKPAMPFSAALATYTAEKKKSGASGDTLNDVRLIIQFLIDRFGDVPVDQFTSADAAALDKLLPDVPDRKGIPRQRCGSLSNRYEYAQQYGWVGLKRLTEARLRNGYHNALSKFFDWLIGQKLYPHAKHTFSEVSGQNLTSLPRDSFEYDEVVQIFSQPLFTGCKTAARMWQPGPYFVQSHIYWAYIMLVLHGLRIGEFGQIGVDDIIVRGASITSTFAASIRNSGASLLKTSGVLRRHRRSVSSPYTPLSLNSGCSIGSRN